MECTYCKNKFSTKTSLNNHQKTAKYCLTLRNVKIKSSNKCLGCGKTFQRLYHCRRHEQKCSSNSKIYELETRLLHIGKERDEYIIKLNEKESQIQEQKQTIQDLQAFQGGWPTCSNRFNRLHVNYHPRLRDPASAVHLCLCAHRHAVLCG